MTRKTPLWRLLAAAGAASLVLAACGGDDDDGTEPEAEATGETEGGEAPSFEGQLHLGTLLPQTGSLAFLGPPEFAGVDLAVLDINEAGGVGGSDVTVSHTDSGDTSTDIASQSTERLLSEDVSRPLPDAFKRTIDEFRAGYVLWFTPAGVTGPGWHDLIVKVKGRNYDIHARRGYFGG